MKINGLVVSVNYSAQLAENIALWRSGMESLTVVTDFKDDMTPEIAWKHGAIVFRTEAFYADGAYFNKGRAMENARQILHWFHDDWILLIDADVIPPAAWKAQLEAANPEPGYLYGCWRYDEHGRRIPDDSHAYGYFQLFHTLDPIAQASPLIDIDWTHAGNADSSLMLRWRREGKLAPPLPFGVIHPGGPNHNWFGVDKPELFNQMQRQRMRLGGGWDSLEPERLRVIS